jgi:hypothetical protein
MEPTAASSETTNAPSVNQVVTVAEGCAAAGRSLEASAGLRHSSCRLSPRSGVVMRNSDASKL